MKKRTHFLVGFLVAALTFGTLMATLGPQKFGRHCHGHWNHHLKHHCYKETGHHIQPSANE
ncbi:MAG TPA: hypothetical protein VK177_14990 [Flavobacteriales bacterium]|nr:hypothetical protein [Flavobacteriales bacterium]